MTEGLKITYLWYDYDVLEVRVSAGNASFRGTADVYVGTGRLLEIAAALEGFPENGSDKREVDLGASGPKFAGGSAKFEFFCKDQAGHAAFRATIESDYGNFGIAESATVYVDFEPVALDEFLAELKRVELEHQGSATLRTIP